MRILNKVLDSFVVTFGANAVDELRKIGTVDNDGLVVGRAAFSAWHASKVKPKPTAAVKPAPTKAKFPTTARAGKPCGCSRAKKSNAKK